MTGPESSTPAPDRTSSSRLEQPGASDVSITAVHAQLLREKPEPREGFSPIPIFILFVFSALIFSGGIYIGTKSGEFSPLAFDVTRNYAGPVAETTSGPDPAIIGARRYKAICANCHQPNGQGVPGAFPPLAGSEYVLGKEDAIILIVRYGLQGPIEVHGTQFNSVMPSQFGSALVRNEAEIAAVLTYVRSQWGNDAPPVTPEKVQEVLSSVPPRTTPFTVEEIQQHR